MFKTIQAKSNFLLSVYNNYSLFTGQYFGIQHSEIVDKNKPFK